MFNPELTNTISGAQILDRRRIGDVWVWFCDKGYGYQPYVTWISNSSNPEAIVCGHYNSTFTKAYEDFCERIMQQW